MADADDRRTRAVKGKLAKLKPLRRAREAVRREFEYLRQGVENLLNQETRDNDEVNVKYKLFQDIWDTLQQHDSQEIRQYKEKAELLRLKKERVVPSLNFGGGESVLESESGRLRNFKLKAVEVKKFNGELTDWIRFWAQFRKIDEDAAMDGSDKYWYLLDSLEPKTDAFEIASSYPQSSENYPKVIQKLKQRFGNEDVLLQVYIRELLHLVITNVHSKDKLPMKHLYLKLDSYLEALKTLNLDKADPATWLFPLVESSLPESVLYNWQRSPLSSHDGSKDDPPKTRLDLLMSFVRGEVEISQKVEMTRQFAVQQCNEFKPRPVNQSRDRKPEKRPMSTLSSFHAGEVRKCAFCDKSSHSTNDCLKAKAMPYEDRIKLLRTKGRCFRCGGPHMGNQCRLERLQCKICKRAHLTILCRGKKEDGGPNPPKRSRQETETSTTSACSNIECTPEVTLQTLMVKVKNGERERIVRAFIDSGSQRSYILKSVARDLGLKESGSECVVHSLFGGQVSERKNNNIYRATLRSVNNQCSVSVEIRDSQKICAGIPRVARKVPGLLIELKEKGVSLSDVGSDSPEIGLLIGADVYAEIITRNVIKLSRGGVAIETKLGWTLMGSVATSEEDSMAMSCMNMFVADARISQLWDLETLGIRDPIEVKSKETLLEEVKLSFTKNIKRREDGRYSVKLPWRENSSLLPQNWEVAYKRLQSATKKLSELGLIQTYTEIFENWEREGFIEQLSGNKESSGPVHYLPHRAIIKHESLTTPVRPVFDASCRVGKAPSLNDCLFTGENSIQLIPELMIRFREKRVAFTSDIRKAFQMIEVEKEDRDSMRFLWWKDGGTKEVVEFRHSRVMFGATCSPFILGCVIRHHLTNLPETQQEMGEALWKSLYVDNCLASVDSFDEYVYFKQSSIEILKTTKMDLRMWYSNVEELESEDIVTPVLGLLWDRKLDVLFVNVTKIEVPEKINKRSVLSLTHRIFDSIGFTCPAVLSIKCLLQRMCKLKLKWDEDLPSKDAAEFRGWCQEVEELNKLKIPRLVTGGVTDRKNWEIHTFTDGSKDAYAAVIFLRSRHGGMTEVQLIAAKSRVAPMKPMGIHRLELMGCLIGTRLCSTVKKALDIDCVREFYWSDSTTALAWIRREEEWGTFVHNRSKEIRSFSDSSNWRHVPGVLNPADLPSRGCTPKQLLRSKWWEGPAWLREYEANWPAEEACVDEEAVTEEKRKTVKKVILTTVNVNEIVKRRYSFQSLVRIVGWIRRFLHNFLIKERSKVKHGPLNDNELRKAELVLVKNIQRDSFPEDERGNIKGLHLIEDEWKVLRVKSRLTYREEPLDFKYPLLLPHNREETRQLIRDLHEIHCHAGVGFLCVKLCEKYWILRARRTVKSVVSKCVKCRRFAAKATTPEAAPLPLERVKDASVFEVVGVDLAGPLMLKNGKKVWFVIFTCAVYRAVHFELVGSLSTRAFIGVLEKFVRKYRRPSVIFSDNGTNFRGTENLFATFDWQSILQEEGISKITWRFNPPLAAWWGGWWERLIRTAKDMLYRTVGKGLLSFKELEKVMRTIAEAMNKRPLTYVSEDPDDLEPLTPAMFLHPLGNVQFPEADMSESQKLRFRYKYVKELQEELKGRFRREYLSLLVSRQPKKTTKPLTVGDLVFVGHDQKKRIHWILGKVTELISGRDGVVRTARVKTQDGILVRPVQRLFPLELDVKEEFGKTVQEQGLRRSGRRTKMPDRYQ